MNEVESFVHRTAHKATLEVSSIRLRRSGKLFSAIHVEWKLEEKNMSWGIFPWWKFLSATFLMTKAFSIHLHKCELFYAAQLTVVIKSASLQRPLCLFFNTTFRFSLVSLKETHKYYFSFFLRQSSYTKKIFSNMIKTLARHFSWNETEEKTSWRQLFQPRPFCPLITNTK